MKAIQVKNILKSYASRSGKVFQALDGISFEVPQGKIYGLLGPNGAGKSTMVKVLTTITAPDSGCATVYGFDVVHDPLNVRRHISVVLQQTAVDTLLTVEDNLRIYAYLHGLGAREVNKRIGGILEEFELEKDASKTVQDLSLGTKRRVQIAKIFMIDAPVIFLDECTTGMDPLMKRRVLHRIRMEAKNGRTILLTTQILSEAEELCDTVMIIHRGKNLACGDLQQLRRLSNHRFRVSLQFSGEVDEIRRQLLDLNAGEARIEGESAELLFKGEEALLLEKLAEFSRSVPISHFEVRPAALEDIFVELVGHHESMRVKDGSR